MKDRVIVIIGLIGLLTGLTCCSDDDDDRRQPEPVAVKLSAYTAPYTDIELMSRKTRAGEWYPSDYKPYGQLSNTKDLIKSNMGSPIGIYFTQDGNEPLVRRFRPTRNDDWLMEDSVPAGNYYLYGYVPYSGAEVANSVITPFNNSYANGAVLTLRGINTVLSQDLCVVVGAKHGVKTGESDPVPVTGTVQPGDFSCQFKANENYLFLLFDHLYAAMRFRFRVAPEYAALRTIKVRTLELSAYEDAECTRPMKKVSTTVTLRTNTTGAYAVFCDITFTTDDNSENGDTAVICDRDTVPVKLTTEWSSYLGFAPKMAYYFVLRTTYDVYDNNRTTEHPDGNLIRQKCVAENKINLQTLFTQATIKRGYMYTIKLTVEPTYLYMLSEPDLDNPTIKIGS